MDGNEIMILIVDRNPHVRDFLGREFRDRGFFVGATGSREGLEGLLRGARRPHLVVLDPDLPDDGGEELVRELAGRRPGPVLVLHGHGVRELDAVAGVAGTVEKNGRTGALHRAVRRALEGIDRESGNE